MCDKPMSIPRFSVDEDLLLMRKSLPIWAKKGQITHAIENNPVVIITAETGSGKTTQVGIIECFINYVNFHIYNIYFHDYTNSSIICILYNEKC